MTEGIFVLGSRTLIDPKNVHGKDLLIDGKAPKVGQKLKNLKLANIFEVGIETNCSLDTRNQCRDKFKLYFCFMILFRNWRKRVKKVFMKGRRQ